jgi:nucleoside-diphosphate-sugar epimerase
MKIFLTGGTGFIGSNFINIAIKKGHDIVAIKRRNSSPRIDIVGKLTWVEGSLDNDFGAYFNKCDVLVHMAAYGVTDGTDNLDECLYWNVTATYRLCKQAYEAGIKKFIIVGSCFEYGMSGDRYDFIPTTAPLEPVTSYAASKAAATVLLQGWATEKGLYMQIMRIFHVYGEGESKTRLWPSLHKAAISGSDFEMTEGRQIRDFLHVKDAVQNLVEALKFDLITAGLPTIRNVGSGHPQSVLEFCNYWWKKWKATGRIKPGVLGYRNNEIMRFVPDIRKINERN